MNDTPQKTRRPILLGLGAVGAALGIASVIWLSNATTGSAASCPAQPERAAAIDDVAGGELAAILATGQGRGYADLAFQDREGNPVTMEDFAGKRLLVNFWATWCVPCREEMPALDALADRYNSEAFEVVTISLDMGDDGPEKAQDFLTEFGLDNLPLYADPSYRAFERLRNEAVTVGLPATLLLDELGCEIAVLQGPAEWDTPDGHRIVEALIEMG